MKIRYEFTDAKATPFGGMYVFSEFLNQCNFSQLFDEVFGCYRRIRKYHPRENVAFQMSAIVAGAERLSDTQCFGDDPVIPGLFSSEIESNNFPADTTLRDDMIHLGAKDEQRQEFLFRINEQHFKRTGLKRLTLDIDGTALPVAGHQEGAEKGYCPQEQGSRCLQALLAICDETETVIAEKLHPGNTHCSNGIIEFCKVILDRLSPQMEAICMRLDTGFFCDELLKLFESYQNVTYEVGVPKHEWLQNKLKTLSYKSYYKSERQYTSFAYGEGLNGAFRNYNVERFLKDAGTQLDCFEPDKYTYRVTVTNKHKVQPHAIFRNYNGRGRMEKHIEELKNQYALGKMVSGKFDVSKALAWVSCLTFTTIGMLRKVAFRRNMAKFRLKRLRFMLFNTVARFVKHARLRVLNITPPKIGQKRLESILQRLWAY